MPSLFAHLGITLGIFYMMVVIRDYSAQKSDLSSMDFRILAFGAVLPDLADKLIGRYLFEEVFHNGRIFFHTLLASVILLTITYLYVKHWLPLAIGVILHIFEDQMWSEPVTLFWPFYLIFFHKTNIKVIPPFYFPYGGQIENYLLFSFTKLFSDPGEYILEICGISIIVIIIIKHKLFRLDVLKHFLLSGKLK